MAAMGRESRERRRVSANGGDETRESETFAVPRATVAPRRQLRRRMIVQYGYGRPPLARTVSPVTAVLSAEARKTTVGATSSGGSSRLIG